MRAGYERRTGEGGRRDCNKESKETTREVKGSIDKRSQNMRRERKQVEELNKNG